MANGAADNGAVDDGATTPVEPVAAPAEPTTHTADRSERAERKRRARRTSTGDRAERDRAERAGRIDETLTRLTAAHAGLALGGRGGTDDVPPEKQSRRPSLARLVAGVLALMVLATVAFGWVSQQRLGAAVRDAAALDPGSVAIVDAGAQRGDENVLVVTTDRAAGGAADTVAVAHAPDGGGPIVVLSFPPDLAIDRPSCARWDPVSASYLDEAVPAQVRSPLASALDLGGPRCATRVVQQLSGLAITGYVGMDVGTVERLADAVQGIDVCVRSPVLDGSLGPVVPDVGPVTLDAVHAADFARASDVPGDPPAGLGRIERQHALLAAVLDEGLAPTALLDVGRQAALRPALGAALVADGVALDDVAELAGSIGRPVADGLVAVAVPASGGEQGAVTLRNPDAIELFAAVRADAPLPARAPGSAPAETGPEPADLTVAVVNASDRRGLAAQVGETLRSLGFGLGEIGSAEPAPQTIIRFSPDQAAAAALLGASVPSATPLPDPGATGVLQLVLGQSFDDVLRAPAEPVETRAREPGSSAAIACP